MPEPTVDSSEAAAPEQTGPAGSHVGGACASADPAPDLCGSGAPSPNSAPAAPEEEGPVCLVVQNGPELQLHPDGERLLRSLGRTPIAVIAVAGLYRTGKSFLLNQLAVAQHLPDNTAAPRTTGPDPSGFCVGHDTESCTRGIWIRVVDSRVWQRPATESASGPANSTSESPPARLLLLDSEGLASVDRDESYDIKVFSLAILLSSLFVYNSMGVIDETAIDRLFMVGELTKNIVGTEHAHQGISALESDGGRTSTISASEAMQSARELAQQFPPFVWLLRDFTLNLTKNGTRITANEYLEAALEEKPLPLKAGRGRAGRIEENNAIRRSFKQLFSSRECWSLVRPVVDEAQLRLLAGDEKHACGGTSIDAPPEGISDDASAVSFRPEFTAQLAALRSHLLARVGVKQVFGQVCTASMLAALTKAYLGAINEGAVPDIRKSWEYVMDETLEAGFHASLKRFDESIKSLSSTLPSVIDWHAAATTYTAAALSEFEETERSIGGAVGQAVAASWRAKLHSSLSTCRHDALIALHEQSRHSCEQILAGLLPKMVEKALSSSDPGTPGRSQSDNDEEPLADALRQMIVDYVAKSSGPSKAEVLIAVLREEIPAAFGSALQTARKVIKAQATELHSVDAALKAARMELASTKESLGVEMLWRGNLENLVEKMFIEMPTQANNDENPSTELSPPATHGLAAVLPSVRRPTALLSGIRQSFSRNASRE